jgi:Hsp33 protein.
VLQNLSPVATAALGRALAGVALLSADLKFGKVLLQIKRRWSRSERSLPKETTKDACGETVHNPHVFLEPENKKLPVGKARRKKRFYLCG